MATIPEPSDTTLSRIWRSWEANAKPRHSRRLGASIIGKECDRAIWYSFRWALLKRFEGRILRLFEKGQTEESWIALDLKSANIDFRPMDPDTGEQWEFSALGDHLVAKLDGVGVGFPEAPATWHLVEMKTHNQKSFDDLIKNCVEKSKPQHYAQMQVGMGLAELDRCVYIAVNKNTDEIWFERIAFNKQDFTALMQRAKSIIFCNEAPEKINESPAWYQCKMCDYAGICHMGDKAEKNCRTCRYASALESGGWGCVKTSTVIDKCCAACKDHEYIEGMG